MNPKTAAVVLLVLPMAVAAQEASHSPTRVQRLVEIPARYPLALIDETLNPDGSVLHRIERIADHIIVATRPGVTANHLDAIAAAHGTHVLEKLHAPDLYLVVTGATFQAQDDLIQALNSDPAILYAEPDYIRRTSVTPNDSSFSQLWGMTKIRAPQAWDVLTGGSVQVAVIDTGVDYTHPDLSANIWVNPREIAGNGVDDDGNGLIDDVRGYDFGAGDADPMDTYGHGTHCSGTIGALGNNGLGVVGVCWNVKIMCMKIDMGGGALSDSAAVQAIYYANAQGAKLSSNSWGGGGFSQSLYNAVSAANQAGVLFVTAAGNSSNNNDTWPDWPASIDLPNVISVAATTPTDDLATFSNYGAISVDLSAPGTNILSTTPGGVYQSYSGTSMACPHVAGATALVWSRFPSENAAAIKARILNGAERVAALSGRCVTGGRLDVGSAITAQTVTVTIASPEAGSAIPTSPVTITGSSSASPGPVSTVTWFNSATGESGPANGTVSWTATVPLVAGINNISITATDPAGRTATAQLPLSLGKILSVDPSSVTLQVGQKDYGSHYAGVNVTNGSATPQNWTIATDADWLSASPSFGTLSISETGSFQIVAVTSDTMPPGLYTGTITVQAGSAFEKIAVTLNVQGPGKPRSGCGSIGFDMMLPLGLIWIVRRRKSLRRNR